MIIQTPYGPTNTNGGEILDLTPLRKKPRAIRSKRATSRKRTTSQVKRDARLAALSTAVLAGIWLGQHIRL